MRECVGRTSVPWWETNTILGEAVREAVLRENVGALVRETVVMGE